MRSIRVSADAFDETLKKELDGTNKVFVLFFGTELPETDESWCPDCVIADPLIRKALLPVQNSVLIEAAVGSRDEWRNANNNPYRSRTDFTIPAIPTLYKWTTSGAGDRLVEEECADLEKLNAFVTSA
ncbi:hypothetical protein CLU79DRAFT_884189 [Phycomyces nitens]|nr:hypothetical protein CLU79DRAFT_884189 [Phycomyces nitens]